MGQEGGSHCSGGRNGRRNVEKGPCELRRYRLGIKAPGNVPSNGHRAYLFLCAFPTVAVDPLASRSVASLGLVPKGRGRDVLIQPFRRPATSLGLHRGEHGAFCSIRVNFGFLVDVDVGGKLEGGLILCRAIRVERVVSTIETAPLMVVDHVSEEQSWSNAAATVQHPVRQSVPA